jgi:LAO/AO transport system kinase
MVQRKDSNPSPQELAASVLEGRRLALARLLSQLESGLPEGRETLNALFPHTGGAHLIGVTGAPGTGKSSLVNQLVRFYRQPESPNLSGGEAPRVAVVAVDPSSPFSGGAILGDRVRMRDLSGDPGVFIRSMASRGSLGGLAWATSAFVQALDAAGFEMILIETVGAGQAEVDVARLAHTTLVVEAPGLGDDIQAIKAGILEIADILVINKADRPGVEMTERALRGMLQLAHPVARVFQHHGRIETPQPGSNPDRPFWQPPILRTVATEGAGIAELAAAIQKHRLFLQENGDWQRREQARLSAELDALLREALVENWRRSISESQYLETLNRMYEREISPAQAVTVLLNRGAV